MKAGVLTWTTLRFLDVIDIAGGVEQVAVLLQQRGLLGRERPGVERVVEQHLQDRQQRLLVPVHHLHRLLAAPAA